MDFDANVSEDTTLYDENLNSETLSVISSSSMQQSIEDHSVGDVAEREDHSPPGAPFSQTTRPPQFYLRTWCYLILIIVWAMPIIALLVYMLRVDHMECQRVEQMVDGFTFMNRDTYGVSHVTELLFLHKNGPNSGICRLHINQNDTKYSMQSLIDGQSVIFYRCSDEECAWENHTKTKQHPADQTEIGAFIFIFVLCLVIVALLVPLSRTVWNALWNRPLYGCCTADWTVMDRRTA